MSSRAARTERSAKAACARPLRVALRCALLLLARSATAAPNEFIPVGDPIEAELRVLETLGPGLLAGRVRLPRLHTRPIAFGEIEGVAAPPETLDPARAIARTRLERVFGRHPAPHFAPDPRHPPTPWAWRRAAEGESFELSLGIEGRGTAEPGRSRFATGSGAHARVGIAVENWLGWSHLLAGHVDRARSFADPIVPENDLIVHTEDTWVGYTAESRRWGGWLGRSRWHWGPGEEASLVLSKTSPAFTGLALRVRLEGLRADAIALSGALDPEGDHQLAAHRIEWQPADGLRLGLSEAASYRGTGWRPLYLIGAVPYILVQRLEVQDSPDSLGRLRNNILVGLDAAWRLRPGTRVYGELLVDDLHARTAHNPNKWGWQVGWDGVGTIASTRLVWGGEYTRISRFVYTSFFGQSYTAHGEPLGFPTGPDASRLRLRAAWDPHPDAQLLARLTRTEKGENDLDEPYVPTGGPTGIDIMRFEGIVERTRQLEIGARWWPAGGVDLTAWGGWRWIENRRHEPGHDEDGAIAAIELRLQR